MRNIWAIVVGAVLLGGIGVSVSRFIGGDDPAAPSQVATPTRTAPARDDAQIMPAASGKIGDMKVTDDDFAVGSKDAPVTVVEYASLTCSHCARFHSDVLPTIKKEFVDTGKVRLIYRDFPLDRLAMAASMVARCGGRMSYFGYIDTFFSRQTNWARSEQPLVTLARLARLGGMGQPDFDACLKNQTVADKILKQRLEGDKTFGVDTTPTLFINGNRFGGGLTVQQFRAVVAPMLKKS